MSKNLAVLIHKLRMECIKALTDKIKNPNNDFSSNAKNAMNTIIELLSSEISIH